MSIVDFLRREYEYAIIPSCSEQGCKLDLSGIRNKVILKGEKIRPTKKISDCLIFTESTMIGIVELKGKTAHPTEVQEKLVNGSLAALEILEECFENSTGVVFCHIVLCKSWSVSEHQVISHRKLKIRGKKYYIITKRCGARYDGIMRT
jgi:hypothetical protein